MKGLAIFMITTYISVNQSIFSVLEPGKSCIASYYRPFSMNIKIKIIRLIPSFIGPGAGLRSLGFNIAGFIL